MAERPYDVLPGDHGNRIRVNTHGSYILRIPRLNRGTAFTHEQRVELGLEGLLPERVTPLEGQLHRAYTRFLRAGSPIEKFAYLQGLRDRNTVLFYRLLSEHLDELMPIVYTPTIGEAIQEFSLWYQQVNGVFLSIDAPERIEASLRATGKAAEDVDLLIVTDSEGILGIGDQGVGGILICIGKKSVYTAAAGLDPDRMVPVVLDVGTNNLSLLNDDLYLGLRHARVRGERYDAFVAAFVAAAQEVFPHAMVHWEDFGADNAHRILETYRDEICTFNDDIQGTAAVTLGSLIAACKASGAKLSEKRVAFLGAGSAGCGIAEQIVAQMKALILTGELGEGQQLPSIRALAGDLRISVITTKRAYEDLERDGFVTNVPGKGCFVAERSAELLREENLRKIEGYMQEIRRLAAACGLTEDELAEIWRGQKEETE